MKKSKLLIVGLIGLLLVGGLVLLGCEKGMCSGKCYQDSDGLWWGCDTLSETCAGSGKCAAWEDKINNVSWIASRNCNCN